MNELYVAQVTTTGGRVGHAQSSDNILSLDLTFPKTMGGPGGKTNPEQLFAAGWSACFGQSLFAVAAQQKVKVDAGAIQVTAKIHVLEQDGAFSLSAELDILLPGVERAVAEQLVEATKSVCVYSKSTKGNVPTTYRVV